MQRDNFGPSLHFPGVIRGLPFEAEFEQTISHTLPDGTTSRISMTGRIYRDSEGRRRQEMYLTVAPGKSVSFAYIVDTVEQAVYVLDDVNKTATKQAFDSIADEIADSAPAIAEESDGDFPTKTVEGFACRSFHVTLPGGVDLESWFSKELKEVLLERKQSALEEKTLRLHNIRRIEPNQQLFRIATTYKIMPANE